MAIINLRDYYPFYTSDCFMEVSEEVAEMFKEFDRKEAAYRLRTYRHKAYYCCSCCCICMQTMQRYEDVVCKASRYLADRTAESCIGCGICTKACPMGTIEMQEGRAIVHSRNCIGCGLCVSRCPAGALRLERRPGAKDRPGRERCERMYI